MGAPDGYNTLAACQDPISGTRIHIINIENELEHYLNILRNIMESSIQYINDKKIYNTFTILYKTTSEIAKVFKEKVMPLLDEIRIAAHGGTMKRPANLVTEKLGLAIATLTRPVFILVYEAIYSAFSIVLIEDLNGRRILAYYALELIKIICSLIHFVRDHIALLKSAEQGGEWNHVINMLEGLEYILASASQDLRAIAVRALGYPV